MHMYEAVHDKARPPKTSPSSLKARSLHLLNNKTLYNTIFCFPFLERFPLPPLGPYLNSVDILHDAHISEA